MLAKCFDIITGKVIAIIFHPWLFENLEQLVTLSGIVSKLRSYAGFVMTVYITSIAFL